MDIERFLSHFKGVKKTGQGWQALCPAHDDQNRSLSVSEGDDGRILLKCFAGCERSDIVKAIGLQMSDLFTNRGKGSSPLKSTAHLHTPKVSNVNSKEKRCAVGCAVCSLGQYAEAKKLPVDFLKGLGMSDFKRGENISVSIPYFNEDGNEGATRYRIGLDGGDRFRWKKGSRPLLYGLWKLDKKAKQIILVEGESDCHTLWFHGFNTVGLPGATNWKEDRDASHFETFEKVFIIHEPDQGGAAVYKWLSRSSIKEKAFIVELGEFKDPSALHMADPEQFEARFNEALGKAVPFTKSEEQRKSKEISEALEKCQDIARSNSILELFEDELPACGLTGENKLAKVLYLALVSRVLDRPVSVVVNGPSSAGKSYLVETVLKFFPTETYYDLTGMSEKNLAYTEEPLQHRFLVLYEATGLSGKFGNYIIRSLLSEGKIKYEFVEKTRKGLHSRRLEKEGPTGLMMTTTSVWLHPENETRLLFLTVNDTRDQTSNVLLTLAKEEKDVGVDFEAWKALQAWLSLQEINVVIPYAHDLAVLTKPVAVRLRRDFGALLNLIKAHAVLHMATREKDASGRIIATLEDYKVVLDLVGKVMAEGVEATVPKTVKETVTVVRELIDISTKDPAFTTVTEVKDKLNLDRSAALRRLNTAIRQGFVKELEQKSKQNKYVIGEPLPTEAGGIFPTYEELQERCMCANTPKTTAHIKDKEFQEDSGDVCMCAGGSGEVKHRLPADMTDKRDKKKPIFSCCDGIEDPDEFDEWMA